MPRNSLEILIYLDRPVAIIAKHPGEVSQILSRLVQKNEQKDESLGFGRIEKPHIGLEAALETSDKWQPGRSLLHPCLVGITSSSVHICQQ